MIGTDAISLSKEGAGAKDGACGAKISTRRPLDSKLCIAKALKVIKI